MPRFTNQGWSCGSCKTWNAPELRVCHKCECLRYEKNAQVHASERAVVYYNPATGEHRTPARNDLPVPDVYARQGFERMEIQNMTKWEKDAGVVHEATTYLPGNEMNGVCPEPPKPKRDPQLIKALAEDMSAAFASGEWTGAEKLIDQV